MPEDNQGEGGGGISVTATIGKEIDRTLGDVVRGLLLPPAAEIGNLLGDSIGLIADRIRLKREANLRQGIDEVNRQLAEAEVPLDQIDPPNEEELHLLLTGLSLSADGELRKLWAGLFAKALAPDSGITAERQFMGVLQSLSPLDAKIIDFLAFVDQTESDLNFAPRAATPKDILKPTPEEVFALDEYRKRSSDNVKAAIQAMRDKAGGYGLDVLASTGWADNLLRQGVIERSPVKFPHVGDLRLRSNDARGFQELAQTMATKVQILEEKTKHVRFSPKSLMSGGEMGGPLILAVRLTPFGQKLARACGLLKS